MSIDGMFKRTLTDVISCHLVQTGSHDGLHDFKVGSMHDLLILEWVFDFLQEVLI